MGISFGAARSRKSRGSLPARDDDSVPDRPRWRLATFKGSKTVGRGFRSDCTAPPVGARSIWLTGTRTTRTVVITSKTPVPSLLFHSLPQVEEPQHRVADCGYGGQVGL